MTTYTDRTPALYGDLVQPIAPRVVRRHFAGLAEAAAPFPRTVAGLADAKERVAGRGEPGFLFTAHETGFSGATHDDTVRMIESGWTEGAERARSVRDGIMAQAPILPRLTRYDVAGQVPDVQRALAGNPMAMRRTAPQADKVRPVLTLQVGIFVSAVVDARKIQDAAAAMVAVVDTLEAGGYPCHVLAVCHMRKGDNFDHELVTQVKAPNEPVSLADAAFICGHPAYFRRLCFFHAITDDACGPIYQTMGSPSEVINDPASRNYRTMTINNTSQLGSPRAMYLANLRYLAKQGCPGIPDDLPTT